MTKATLAIPTHDAGPLLGEVLAAVDRQPGAGALERIAIDTASQDGTVELLRRHGFAVEGIGPADFDHGATRDAMIERAEGEVVVLLTQDAVPADDGWLAALLACYDDPAVGAAYCKQIPRPDCNPFIARRIGEWTAGKDQRVVQEPCDEAGFGALEPLQRLARCAYDNVAGSVRREAWRAVGGFGRRAFGEDVAFGKRLILGGWKIAFEPRSAVVHSHNRSPKDEGKRIYCDHQNLRELFGLHLLPDFERYDAAVRWGRDEYVRIVDGLDLPRAEALRLADWARQYAHWAALGMFLGAASRENMAGAAGGIFRALDARMHAGI